MKFKEKNLSNLLGSFRPTLNMETWKEPIKFTENTKNIGIVNRAIPYFQPYLNYANTNWCSSNRWYLKKNSKPTKARYYNYLSRKQIIRIIFHENKFAHTRELPIEKDILNIYKLNILSNILFLNYLGLDQHFLK